MNYSIDEEYVFAGLNMVNLNSYHIDEFLRRAIYKLKPIKPLLDGTHSHEEISDAIDTELRYGVADDLRKALKNHSLDEIFNCLMYYVKDSDADADTDIDEIRKVGFVLTQVAKEFLQPYLITRPEPCEEIC